MNTYLNTYSDWGISFYIKLPCTAIILFSSKAILNAYWKLLHNNGYRMFIQTFWKISETHSHGVIFYTEYEYRTVYRAQFLYFNTFENVDIIIFGRC